MQSNKYNKIKDTWNRKVHDAINHKVGRKQQLRYTYDKWAIKGYCGQGFHVHNRTICKQQTRPTCWGYDIHWAYGAALIDYNYPLNNDKSITPTSLGVYKIKYTYAKVKLQYMDFYYFLYKKNANKFGNYYILYLTNIDYDIFMDLYDTDAIIIDKVYYKNIGPLPDKLISAVKEAYVEKKRPENKDVKQAFESAFYGKLCQSKYKLCGDEMLYMYDKYSNTDYNVAQELTGLDGDILLHNEIRTEYCIIPTFQTAYIRRREWELFKKYYKYVVYMNTDSIYAIKPLDLGEDKGLGCYGIECENTPIRFIRYCAYILFNLDGSIKKSVVSGMCDDATLTPSLIELLEKNKQPIRVYGMVKKDNKKVKQLVDLKPLYIWDNY